MRDSVLLRRNSGNRRGNRSESVMATLLCAAVILGGCANAEGPQYSQTQAEDGDLYPQDAKPPVIESKAEDRFTPGNVGGEGGLPPPDTDPVSADGNKAAKSTGAALLKAADDALARGDLVTAIGLYRRAIRFAGSTPYPFLGLGNALMAAGSAADAAEAYSSALGRDAKNVDALLGLGNALATQRQLELAANKYQAVLRIDPREIRAYNGLGVVLDKSGDFEGAQATYRQGLAVDPEDLRLMNNLGLSLAFSGQYDEAITVLRSLAFGPNASPRHRQNLAMAYGLAGRTDEAAEIARMDLDEASVQQNLSTYAALRARSEASRMKGRSAQSVGVALDEFQLVE